MSKGSYIVIIGDIHDSRQIENRQDIQSNFMHCLERINRKYKKYIISNFSISMGDSFQGLLKIGAPVTTIILDIELMMQPITFRFGIGIGEITTEIDPENSQLNDGPAYHHARQALEWIEGNEQKYASRKTSVILLTEEKETPNVRLINTVFALTSVIKGEWTARQKEVIKAYMENNENQYQTADALNIGQSSVSKALKSAKYYAFKTALEDIDDFIKSKVEGRVE